MKHGTIMQLNPPLDYIIHYKKIKHVYVRIKNGLLVISSPPHFSPEKIMSIMNGILPKIQKMREKTTSITSTFSLNQWIPIFGEKYELIDVHCPQRDNSIPVDKNDVKKSFYQYTEPLLVKYLKNRIDYYWPLFNDSRLAPPFVLQVSKSRYGAYFHPGHHIKFNQRLIHLCPSLIDYVVVHELAHAIVQNHSTSFYRVVAQVMPDYANRIKELKKIRMPL